MVVVGLSSQDSSIFLFSNYQDFPNLCTKVHKLPLKVGHHCDKLDFTRSYSSVMGRHVCYMLLCEEPENEEIDNYYLTQVRISDICDTVVSVAVQDERHLGAVFGSSSHAWLGSSASVDATCSVSSFRTFFRVNFIASRKCTKNHNSGSFRAFRSTRAAMEGTPHTRSQSRQVHGCVKRSTGPGPQMEKKRAPCSGRSGLAATRATHTTHSLGFGAR